MLLCRYEMDNFRHPSPSPNTPESKLALVWNRSTHSPRLNNDGYWNDHCPMVLHHGVFKDTTDYRDSVRDRWWQSRTR